MTFNEYCWLLDKSTEAYNRRLLLAAQEFEKARKWAIHVHEHERQELNKRYTEQGAIE